MESHQGRKGPSDQDDVNTPVSAEDEEWLLATQDVVPLKDREVDADSEQPSPLGGLAERLRSRREPVASESDGSLPALDRRTAERLRRGQIEIEGQLDLHGLTQDEAFLAIQTFLYESLQEGRRCVLLITGKGTARDGGGVLRSAVPRWLTEGAYAPHLVGIAPAHAQHGGDGALYVLLRRQR
ncbi:MAG: Smr/MutS family protein [Thermodesulfobacteriota bacterium]